MLLKYVKSIMVFIIVMLFSCSNDIEEVKELSESFIIPDNSIENFTMFFSDSGYVKTKILSPLLINKEREEKKESNKEFPNGIEILFFDKNKNLENFMRSDYAIYFPFINFVEARGNVLIINNDKDTIMTEKIFWEQEKGLIYTREYSKIIQNGQVIIGKNGFESDEKFSWYKIYNTEGSINIKDSVN